MLNCVVCVLLFVCCVGCVCGVWFGAGVRCGWEEKKEGRTLLNLNRVIISITIYNNK